MFSPQKFYLLCVFSFSLLLIYPSVSLAALTIDETPTRLKFSNSRLNVSVNKTLAAIDRITLDGQNLLGDMDYEVPIPGGPTGNGVSGLGPYLDCFCSAEGNGFYHPGQTRGSAKVKVIQGMDSTNVPYAGFVMNDVNPKSGQIMQLYVFLREGETGLHTFSRIAYLEPKGPTRSQLQEFRTLFRPNTPLWTHLVTNEHTVAPIPNRDHIRSAPFVQDATLDLSAFPNDPFVKDTNNYFTKYSFADVWRDHEIHGLVGNGSSPGKNKDTWGAWLNMWNRETYYGGPLRADLTVDGIVYDYMVSNHYGANIPNITVGFDRTFGPNYYLFTHHPPGTQLSTVYNEARAYLPPQEFLAAVSKHVPNYIAPARRSTFNANLSLPPNAKRATLVLSASGHDAQDNAASPSAYQYWATASPDGRVTIPSVAPGTYRVTVYTDGVFGDFVHDNVKIPQETTPFVGKIVEERAGTEIWRLGVPDHSAGEFRHGYAVDKTHRLGLQEYRIFHGAFSFSKDFPDGVKYRIGKSVPEKDWNYVQWSGQDSKVSKWSVLWDGKGSHNTTRQGKAVLTLQMAGVRTSVGNVHTKIDANDAPGILEILPLAIRVNGKDVGTWNIPRHFSASCAVRSGIVCYNSRQKFSFDASILKDIGENELTLALPTSRSTESGTAKLPTTVYVQYDALRLEVE